MPVRITPTPKSPLKSRPAYRSVRHAKEPKPVSSKIYNSWTPELIHKLKDMLNVHPFDVVAAHFNLTVPALEKRLWKINRNA